MTVADPGFPVGGHAPIGGHGPPMQALFGENVFKNERIGSHRGWRAPGTPPLDPPMYGNGKQMKDPLYPHFHAEIISRNGLTIMPHHPINVLYLRAYY